MRGDYDFYEMRVPELTYAIIALVLLAALAGWLAWRLHALRAALDRA